MIHVTALGRNNQLASIDWRPPLARAHLTNQSSPLDKRIHLQLPPFWLPYSTYLVYSLEQVPTQDACSACSL